MYNYLAVYRLIAVLYCDMAGEVKISAVSSGQVDEAGVFLAVGLAGGAERDNALKLFRKFRNNASPESMKIYWAHQDGACAAVCATGVGR